MEQTGSPARPNKRACSVDSHFVLSLCSTPTAAVSFIARTERIRAERTANPSEISTLESTGRLQSTSVAAALNAVGVYAAVASTRAVPR
jgi:hypothetical protein